MDSFSSPSSRSSPNFSKEDLMDQLKVQLAQAYAEEFLECFFYGLGGKCFDKCITKHGSSLSGSESSSISRCVDRYIEATGIIGNALFNQLHRKLCGITGESV